MVKLRFVYLMMVLAIYENSDVDGLPPSQNELLGKPPKYDGLINGLMFSIYLLNDDGLTTNPAYEKRLCSASTLGRGVEQLRKAKLITQSGEYKLTKFGVKVAKDLQNHMEDHPHYSELPIGAIVRDGDIEYKYYEEV